MPSTSPKDTTKAAFMKYSNDKTIGFINEIITGLLLLRIHGCKQCQTLGFRSGKINRPTFFLFQIVCNVTVGENLAQVLRYDWEQLTGNSCSSRSLRKGRIISEINCNL